MFAYMKKLITDCLTENDGKSFCPFRVAGFSLAMGGIPTFLGCVIYTTLKNNAFDPIQFGTAFGAMMTGFTILAVGVHVKAKSDTAAS